MARPPPASVLCPDDITSSGYLYGWTSPVVVVCGVLDADSSEHAQVTLQRLVAQSGIDVPSELLGDCPVILGRCTFAKPRPELSFYDAAYGSHRLILYSRPDLRRLQLYTLDAQLHLFKPSAGPSPRHAVSDKTSPDALIGLDPTRLPVSSSSILRPETIHQLNYGQLFSPCRSRVSQLGVPTSDRFRRHQDLVSNIVKKCRETIPARVTLTALQCSVLFSQVTTRIAQVLSLPGDYPRLAPIITTALISQYIAFYNCIWLILNDIIIGWAVGTIICEHAAQIATILEEYIRRLLIDDLQWVLVWLNNWPAGLKLNSELSQFYCHLLLGAVTGWNRVLQAVLLPYLPQLIYFAGAVGTCGVTLTISLCSDVLALTTAHVRLCYYISCLVYRLQLNIASSLWNLFRGKRYNVLRHRVDSWSYDLDQLLFGTILFTLAAFIFPTTLTYYALFAVSQLVTSLILAGLNVALVLVNQFPLFALLLRLKDPRRLPGGIVFTRGRDDSLLRIQNQTLPISTIFAHYQPFWASFVMAHNPARLLGSILRARTIVGESYHS
ncbi:phosphatidylinositol N-acetylglucosaminyltransferase subunit Q/GPI1 [Phanerochaete sordida]|uniref:Phosphatidylinositol N-acetylglucosaminyltransferase subunit Q/GPI1 n=1 Tax=Phanerochaete sordida TaxID=48140 RepID=A0A9P3GLN0_9APHY|nr:phosphatidylinositol N-acetylglucosaminyltransferase subunit Q/GPI1 [Phanerochaete sordida]